MQTKRIMIGLVLLLAGCAQKMYERQAGEHRATSVTIQKTETVSGEKWTEKDSVVIISAPVEQSRNMGVDSSYLSTSLAWSVAVWKNGRLWHTIGNFPQMAVPAKMIFRDHWYTSCDTLVVRDTLREKEYTALETESVPSWWERLWGRMVNLFLVAFVAYLLWCKFWRR